MALIKGDKENERTIWKDVRKTLLKILPDNSG